MNSDNLGPRKKIGIKQNGLPTSSVNSNKAEVEQAKSFDNLANQKYEDIEEYKSEMMRLAVELKKMIHDQVLPENKGPLKENLEKEVLDRLTKLSAKMNEDETQPESAGSNAMCLLLLKCLLWQRDSINKISHDLNKLDVALGSMKSQHVEPNTDSNS